MTTKRKPIRKSSPSNTLLESLLKYTFAALLFFIPLYPKFPFLTVPGIYVAIRSEDFILSILAVLLFLYFIKKPLFFLKSATTRSIILFWLIGFLSILSGIYLTKTVPLTLGLLHWGRRIEYMLPFFAGFVLVRNRENFIFFVKLLPLVALGVFGYGVAQLYYQAPVISTQNVEFSKGLALTLQPGVNLSSTFAGHYDLAAYLTMTIALLTPLFFTFKKNLHKLLSFIILLALFWLQLKTGSRIAFGASVISVTLVLAVSKKPLWIILALLIAFIGMVNTPSISGRFGALLDVFRFERIEQQIKGVMDSRTELLIRPAYAQSPSPLITRPPEEPRAIQQDRSTSIRLDVEWPRALRALYKNPFLGTGYGSISLATDNDYLRALGETGLLGFLAWITILVNLFATFIKGIKSKLPALEHHFLIGSLGMLVGFLIIATFIDVFEASKVATLFWMYTGLSFGLSLNKS